MNPAIENNLKRRVAGHHDLRLDGMLDLVVRASGLSILDIGCNRGLVGFEFANNGAKRVHGVDIDAECIGVARHLFADLRNVESRFEVVDLAKGPKSLELFDPQQYDIIVMLATYHKLKRIMPEHLLSALIKHLAARTRRYFAWRGTSEKHRENEVEMENLDRDLGAFAMKRIHTSYISLQLGVAAIWSRA